MTDFVAFLAHTYSKWQTYRQPVVLEVDLAGVVEGVEGAEDVEDEGGEEENLKKKK